MTKNWNAAKLNLAQTFLQLCELETALASFYVFGILSARAFS